MSAAQKWSDHMVDNGVYHHSGGDWYQDQGYFGGVLENIGGGASTAEYMFEGWMESPTHRRNLTWCYPTTDPSYNPARVYYLGVGYNDGRWTLALGN